MPTPNRPERLDDNDLWIRDLLPDDPFEGTHLLVPELGEPPADPAPTPQSFRLTDTGHGQRLVHLHGWRLRA